jgi:hypothetical protein
MKTSTFLVCGVLCITAGVFLYHTRGAETAWFLGGIFIGSTLRGAWPR